MYLYSLKWFNKFILLFIYLYHKIFIAFSRVQTWIKIWQNSVICKMNSVPNNIVLNFLLLYIFFRISLFKTLIEVYVWQYVFTTWLHNQLLFSQYEISDIKHCKKSILYFIQWINYFTVYISCIILHIYM